MDRITKKRCAVYTRKSLDEGLDTDFNTLDAQREAGENFINGQKVNGWVCLPTKYDDGGYSGSNLNRPALKQLLEDCEAGFIDIVVVYKIDRLSRSISDFSELLKQFEKWGVSYVSVTQDINTTSSSGRMMQNLLMTFAQYERELIAERVRDKMAASKQRGMWMGGAVPYGFKVENKKLFINIDESKIVKRIFKRFVETQSPKLIAGELNADGLLKRNGQPWETTQISRILSNYTYVGEVFFKGQVFKGEHDGIINRETWERTRAIIKANAPYDHANYAKGTLIAPLKGILRCGHCNSAMMPVFAKRGQKRYYYYTCNKDLKRGKSICPVKRIGSQSAEDVVKTQTKKLFMSRIFLEKIAQQSNTPVIELQEYFKEELWKEATIAELNRLYELLFEKITIFEDHMDLEIKTSSIQSLIEGITQ